jgi:hypothetical protein
MPESIWWTWDWMRLSTSLRARTAARTGRRNSARAAIASGPTDSASAASPASMRNMTVSITARVTSALAGPNSTVLAML